MSGCLKPWGCFFLSFYKLIHFLVGSLPFIHSCLHSALDCPLAESWPISKSQTTSIQTLMCVCPSFSMTQDPCTPHPTDRWYWYWALTARGLRSMQRKALSRLDVCCTCYWLMLSSRTTLWTGRASLIYSPSDVAFLLHFGEHIRAVGRVVLANCNSINHIECPGYIFPLYTKKNCLFQIRHFALFFYTKKVHFQT